MRLPPLLLVMVVVCIDQFSKYAARCCGSYVESGGAIEGVSIASVVLAVFIFWMFRSRREIAVPVALIVGGGLSNIIDRLVFGSVTDFISIGSLMLNIADIFIVTGVIAVLMKLAFSRE